MPAWNQYVLCNATEISINNQRLLLGVAMSMTGDDLKEIREVFRQELAAFFNARSCIASRLPEQGSNELDPFTAAQIRSAARSALADARAKKQAKLQARSLRNK